MNNMTALMSAYARGYHANYEYKIFDDYLALKLLTKEEQENISKNLSKGIKFFNPTFEGTNEMALKWIIDNQISPIMLARSAFAEKILANEIKLGAKSYLIFGSGYDTYAYRSKDNIKVYEIDKEDIINDKINRVKDFDTSKVTYIKSNLCNKDFFNKLLENNYNPNEKSVSSLLGLSYYLEKEDLLSLLKYININISDGSALIMDYPTKEESDVMDKNSKLAAASNEQMKSKYTIKEIEDMLLSSGFLLYEHLNNEQMTNEYFYNYNTINPNTRIIAPKGVSYLLAVKKS